MKKSELSAFLIRLLIKIDEVINFLEQDNPKHILAYNKMLGVQQKVLDIEESERGYIFPQIIKMRSVIFYLLNGRYDDSYKNILSLKQEIQNIVKKIGENSNERDKDK